MNLIYTIFPEKPESFPLGLIKGRNKESNYHRYNDYNGNHNINSIENCLVKSHLHKPHSKQTTFLLYIIHMSVSSAKWCQFSLR